jgi:hypothetical protein
MRQQLAREIAKRKTVVPSVDEVELTTDTTFSVYTKAMSESSAALGFERDAKRSTKSHPVFSKRLTDSWVVALVVEDKRAFAGAVGFAPSKAYCEIFVEIRHEKIKEKADGAGSDRWLHIRLQRIVPGFKPAYCKFSGADGLRHSVDAQLAVYQFFAPFVESQAIKDLLS